MSSKLTDSFSCDSCGRKFVWKPELAGKKVKCKCGAALVIPARLVEEREPDEFSLADFPDEPIAVAPFLPQVAPPPAPASPSAGRKSARAGIDPDASLRFPTIRRPIFDDTPAKKREFIKLIAVGIALVAIIGFIFVAKSFIPQLAPDPTRNMPGQDGRVVTMTRIDGATELMRWLEQSGYRGVVDRLFTRGDLAAWGRLWYAHGAKNVLAFSTSETKLLAIELPDEIDKRKFFFDWAERYRLAHPALRQPPQSDVHQKYVVIEFLPPNGA